MISNEILQNKVFNNSLQTCDYISGYENGKSIITVRCKKHEYEFQTNWENVRRDNRAHHICPICQQEDRDKNKIEVECAYCHKKFFKSPSKLKKSKSGLYFCCREHKDIAQGLASGNQFDTMRPDHYKNAYEESGNYRRKAFLTYPHQCELCGYNEDEDILQVHHIDENRQNNNVENLMILCPNCHAKITYGGYVLIGRNQLLKNKNSVTVEK